MNQKEFFSSLDIRNDFRTYLNFIKLPLIILIRFPLVLFIWFIVWLGEYLEDKSNCIPGWERYYPKTKRN